MGLCIHDDGSGRVVLTLTCDGSHGMFAPAPQTFAHDDGYIGNTGSRWRPAGKTCLRTAAGFSRAVLLGEGVMTANIPAAVLAQHVVVLGKTRAGKSSTMRLLVEDLLDQHQPLCIIDPKGDWWGLKSSADGKSAGYPVIIIFGGEHADVALNPHAGADVRRAAGDRQPAGDHRSWRLDGRERTRFFIDFASTFFRHTRGARWLVIDEVEGFAPQGKVLDVDAGKMLHWANRLASEGAGKGVTLISASQRPQKVHKDYLTSHETLIAKTRDPSARPWRDQGLDRRLR